MDEYFDFNEHKKLYEYFLICLRITLKENI